MSRYVGRYVSTCDMCLWTKSFWCHPIGELHPLPIPSAPWDTISVDFIVELPQSAGHDSIMVVVDTVTKHAHFVSTVTTISASGATHLFLNHVWKHHGLPRRVVSNRGPQFVVEFTRELYRLLGIMLAATTAYHLQGDGQTEGSTRNWNSISDSSPTKDKMIRWGSCLLQNSSTTTRFILPLSTLLSSLTPDVSPKWALNWTNLSPAWNPSMSSKIRWQTAWRKQRRLWPSRRMTWRSTTIRNAPQLRSSKRAIWSSLMLATFRPLDLHESFLTEDWDHSRLIVRLVMVCTGSAFLCRWVDFICLQCGQIIFGSSGPHSWPTDISASLTGNCGWQRGVGGGGNLG